MTSLESTVRDTTTDYRVCQCAFVYVSSGHRSPRVSHLHVISDKHQSVWEPSPNRPRVSSKSVSHCNRDGSLSGFYPIHTIVPDLKTAPVERDHFSSGTSSRSTKLIPGGVRYLQKAIMK
ncbi:hypothetical protein DPEC_G00047050 [Dallia pectoralis]|uniref:Uncharacterized protein n=1 Tax=Dallia pectoralis TaxID=75939 RepID=A0ACC2HAS0_DALPE|nr:hypothetical protein DPEC_G00047050 [Dallia pectoralis]